MAIEEGKEAQEAAVEATKLGLGEGVFPFFSVLILGSVRIYKLLFAGSRSEGIDSIKADEPSAGSRFFFGFLGREIFQAPKEERDQVEDQIQDQQLREKSKAPQKNEIVVKNKCY